MKVCTRNEPVYTVMEYMLYGDLKTYLLARRHLAAQPGREEQDEVHYFTVNLARGVFTVHRCTKVLSKGLMLL